MIHDHIGLYLCITLKKLKYSVKPYCNCLVILIMIAFRHSAINVCRSNNSKLGTIHWG